MPVPFVAISWMAFRQGNRARLQEFAVMALAFSAATLLFALPMARYVNDNTEYWRGHQKTVNLTSSDKWDNADGFSAKADILWRRAREWNHGLIYGDRPDLGDGLATKNHPVVDPIVYVLALAGLVVAFWNFRRAEHVVLIACVAILPFGALLTINDGLFRRTLGLAPFVAVLAALPLAWLWEKATLFRKQETYIIYAAVLLVPLFTGARAVDQYFGPVQDNAQMRYVYPRQLDAASHYMDDLPRDTVVYFYSSRWSFNYETRRFLAPMTFGVYM